MNCQILKHIGIIRFISKLFLRNEKKCIGLLDICKQFHFFIIPFSIQFHISPLVRTKRWILFSLKIPIECKKREQRDIGSSIIKRVLRYHKIREKFCYPGQRCRSFSDTIDLPQITLLLFYTFSPRFITTQIFAINRRKFFNSLLVFKYERNTFRNELKLYGIIPIEQIQYMYYQIKKKKRGRRSCTKK